MLMNVSRIHVERAIVAIPRDHTFALAEKDSLSVQTKDDVKMMMNAEHVTSAEEARAPMREDPTLVIVHLGTNSIAPPV